ncbi:hypothetical protein LOK49_LG05G03175 [Camellia lanceoleosa]|uniref:Uncharacterized protein n=1 Tax=Camellia lanceoleosa TaxID=1840588 RepID=A0ACC0HJK5_9ERIC|nr:hypothetical protein LOK49_LG05G03175 [Camellia lanceoleosa]
MASSSSVQFVEQNTTTKQCFTNSSYCCLDDLNQFAVSLQQGPSWPFTTRKKLYLALVNGMMNTADEKVAKRHISLNPEHCKSLDVSLGDTILLKVFVPPLNGFDVDVLRIMVELLPRSSSSTQMKRGAAMGLHHMDDRLAILENLHAFQIDGLKVLNNIFIIGTTNRKELIDEALLRTDGCSGSAFASLVTRAHSYVVVHTGKNGLLQHVKNDFKVTMNHFLCAIEDVKSRLQESDLEPSRMGKEEMQFSTEVLRMQQEIARLKENIAHFQAMVETKLFSTEVLRMQQEIARLKENIAHFQAMVETKLETLRCELLK